MSDTSVSLTSRVILSQVIGRICFPQNHASLVCRFKNRDIADCEDEIEEKLECQSEVYVVLMIFFIDLIDLMIILYFSSFFLLTYFLLYFSIEAFADKPEFLNYRRCLEREEFDFAKCVQEKETLHDYIQTTDYRYQ